jgi:hypothetical protein
VGTAVGDAARGVAEEWAVEAVVGVAVAAVRGGDGCSVVVELSAMGPEGSASVLGMPGLFGLTTLALR